MWLEVARLLGGGALLYFGAEWLVKGSSGLAAAYGVRPLVVGLTVVAYGTSAPELAVSTLAALDGKSAIALGNVVGSNIANLGLILGVTALISPPKVDPTLIRREVPVLVASALVLPLVLLNGVVSRLEGVLLLGAALAFTVWMVRTAKSVSPAAPVREEAREEQQERAAQGSKLGLGLLALIGLAVLLTGGKLFVDGAVALALSWGMSDRLVGLTIVAVGTSLPELAASVTAALRGHSAIAIGNVVGSNIFNVLLILGGAATTSPITGSLGDMKLDLICLGVLTAVAAVFLAGDRRVSRVEGGVLVASYGSFVALLVFG